MASVQKIINLTRSKTRKLTLMLNDELVEQFKCACEKNNTKPTKLFETWIIDYLDKNEML